MNVVAITPSTLPALVIALCFAVGLNTYGCVFALGVMARMEWVTLPPGLGGVANGWLMAAFGFLFLGEFVADKIPGFDVIWNLLHTFVRIPVAAVLAFAAASPLPLGMQMAVTLLGAGFAAVAHGSKTALRVAVMPSPEPVSNVALSLGGDAMAVWLGWMAMRHPVAGGLLVVGLAVAGAGLGWWGFKRIRAGWARRFRDRRVRGDRTTPAQTMVPSGLGHPDLQLLLNGEAGEFLPQVRVDGNAKAEVFFAEAEGLFARVADGVSRVEGRSGV